MIEFQIWGLAGAVAVEAFVGLLKLIWPEQIKDRYAVIAAVVVGLALSTLAHLSQQVAGVGTVVDIVGAGLMAGLASGGWFAAIKKR